MPFRGRYLPSSGCRNGRGIVLLFPRLAQKDDGQNRDQAGAAGYPVAFADFLVLRLGEFPGGEHARMHDGRADGERAPDDRAEQRLLPAFPSSGSGLQFVGHGEAGKGLQSGLAVASSDFNAWNSGLNAKDSGLEASDSG